MNNKFKAIIIDDERLARQDLSSLLKSFDNIELVGEADNVDSGINLIDTHNPDLIFLDIQMPGETGFDLIEKSEIKAKIIFITAYDEFALQAFDVNALDYLLKPINPERLKNAIEKIEFELAEPISNKTMEYEDFLFLSINSHLKFIPIKSIMTICSAGDYTEVLTKDGKKGLTLKTMKEWETRLPPAHFTRIHRSTIVNMEFVDHLEEWYNSSYRIFMKNLKDPYVISRRYVSKLKAQFS